MLFSEEEMNAESSEDWYSGVMDMGSDIQTSWLQKSCLDSAPSCPPLPAKKKNKKLLAGGGFSGVPKEGGHPFCLSQVWWDGAASKWHAK